jgi:uncharacterized protein (UPF0276 family)
MRDHVGLGWRPELAAGILAHLESIDVLEVIADDLFDAPRPARHALRSLGATRPLALHGVSLGLASAAAVDGRRLEKMARLAGELQPAFWSEHLAFVRAGGLEIGHLAAPPRTRATLDGLAANFDRARRIVGTAPLLENVATLLEPPGSEMDEAGWTAAVLEEMPVRLLLDLHNLHANAFNFGFDAAGFLGRIPLDRVKAVHLAGGRLVAPPAAAEAVPARLLDDHLHDVPDPVYALLEELASRYPQPLTVILERDGAYPPMAALLDQLARARAALERGRARADHLPPAAPPAAAPPATAAPLPEDLLARIYVDPLQRAEVLADPHGFARRAGLSAGQGDALAALDRPGLALAAASFARKRAARR